MASCSTCYRLREPINAAALPVKLCKYRQFGECLAIDLFELVDVSGHRLIFLNMFDLASKFQVVTTLASKHPNVVWERLLQGWFSWAGPPEELLCDLGGEFKRELAAEVESMGIHYRTTAAISPTQNAACERAGGAWKLHAKAMMDGFLSYSVLPLSFGLLTARWTRAATHQASGCLAVASRCHTTCSAMLGG